MMHWQIIHLGGKMVDLLEVERLAITPLAVMPL